MWEVFKILLLCFISVYTTLSFSLLFTCILFVLIVLIYHDFDFTIGIEQHAINKFKQCYFKVRNFYSTNFCKTHTNTYYMQYTPTMNSLNKQSSSFELSRFNRSGSASSPNCTLPSKHLTTSTPIIQSSLPLQKNMLRSTSKSPSFYNNSLINYTPRSLLSTNNILKPETIDPPRNTIQTVTGPLLASTRFNINVGTYTDLRSPGLASRVAYYNNELSGEQPSIHSKYNSPGHFPMVQLHKKELPILNRTPKRCTVRIAPPDPEVLSADHANAILRNSFLQNTIDPSNIQEQEQTEINTKSVLEALKEISRKRIHTNDDSNEISKRQRKNSQNLNNGELDQLCKDGKRMREDTPPKSKDTCVSSVVNSSKRICVVDEIESSLSSSRLMRLHQQQGQKRKKISNTLNINKQRRISNNGLVSKETQTITSPDEAANKSITNKSAENDAKKISTSAQTDTEKLNHLNDIQMILENSRSKNKDYQRIERKQDPSKLKARVILSEEPVKIAKQNKLSVILSAFSNKKPELVPMPVITLSSLKDAENNKDKTDGAEPTIIGSILSPKNKPKHDKHVTFAIPSTEKSTTNSSVTSTVITTAVGQMSSSPVIGLNFASPTSSTTPLFGKNNDSLTTTTNSTNIITSTLEYKKPTTDNYNTSASGNLGTMFSPQKSPSLTATSDSFKIIGTPSGGINTSNASTTPISNTFMLPTMTSNANTTTLSNPPQTNTQNTNAMFTNKLFGATTTTPAVLTSITNTNTNVSQPTNLFNFGNKDAAKTSITSTPISTTIAASTSNIIIPNFGAISSSSSSLPTSSNNNPLASAIKSPGGGFKFDLDQNITKNNTSTANAPNSGFTFGNNAPMFNSGSTTAAAPVTTSPSLFSNVNPTSNSPSNIFGKSSLTTTTATPTNPTPPTNIFGGAGTSNSNVTNIFGGGKNSTISPATTITTPTTNIFGKSIIAMNNATTTAPALSTTTTATMLPTTSIFGPGPSANKTPNDSPYSTVPFSSTFGNVGFQAYAPKTTTTSTLNPSSSSNSNNNNINTTNSSSNNNTGIFSFGLSTTSNAAKGFTFGAAAAPTATTTAAVPLTTSSITAPSLFGATTAPTAAPTSAPEAAPLFGLKSSTPFGGGSTNSGLKSTTPFDGSGASSSGGGSTFGSSTTPMPFGALPKTTVPSTTTPSMTFGQSSTSGTGIFGTSAFSNVPKTTMFGESSNTNNSNNNNNNNSNNNNTSGAGTSGINSNATNNNNNNAFGSTTSIFGGTNQPSTNLFGTPNSNNAANNNSIPGGLFSNNTQQPSGFNSFAAQPSTDQQPTGGIFTFGSSGSAAPAPSSSSTANNTSGAFQFGAAPKTNGFSFGGAANNNSSSINFGASSTPSVFGSPSGTIAPAPAPVFGSPASTGGFNAPTPTAGIFNIGSGSTTGSKRLMIKARRRN